MKKIAILLWIALCFSPVCIRAAEQAEANELVSPHTALISPGGARLEVTQKLIAKSILDRTVVDFVLPADAANLQLAIPGQTIVRWSSTPVLLNNGSPLAGGRAEIERSKVEVSARLDTIKSRLALWQGVPKNANAQDISQLQSSMQEAMPGLYLEQARLERELRLINEELSRMPRPSDLGERVRVVLGDNVKAGDEITVNYSYNHDGCGWEAVYDFNTRPDEGSGDMIDVRFLAEVWQYTGINWDKTEITLATKAYGPREPEPMPEWVIDSADKRPQARKGVSAYAVRAMNAESADDQTRAAGVTANTDTIYANWKLAEKGLAQGRSRMQITAAAWKAPLEWLARPGKNSNQVWLMAKYDLPADQAWPAGLAEYSVNGQNVGTGEFQPKSGAATLYFGADPRVTITTRTNDRKRGESGIINTTKSWTWSWTFTLHNDHNKPVMVRVERPLPIVVDSDVKVSFRNDPQPQDDVKEHLMIWNVEVPAHGNREIQHSVTVTSPTKLPLLPDVP